MSTTSTSDKTTCYRYRLTKKCAAISLVICGLAMVPSLTYAEPLQLLCNDTRIEAIEKAAIATKAADVVSRVNKHTLRVQTTTKTLTFKDKPPYDENFAGPYYYFCDRKLGFILLTLLDGNDFTGLLINEATGQVVPGGESVILSEDRRAYLASFQSNGMDGGRWQVYSISGKLSWDGYNFIQKDGPQFAAAAALSNPTWTATGELIADAQCYGEAKTRWRVKLIKKSGTFDWYPTKACQ